jgi:hypothetical protein
LKEFFLVFVAAVGKHFFDRFFFECGRIEEFVIIVIIFATLLGEKPLLLSCICLIVGVVDVQNCFYKTDSDAK